MEHFLPIGGLRLIVTFKVNSYEHTKSHQALSKLNWMLHKFQVFTVHYYSQSLLLAD